LAGNDQLDSVVASQRVVDLFCGAGGMSEGFRLAGFETILGVDSWEPACATFAAHHQQARVLQADMQEVEDETFIGLSGVNRGDLGILCGGPPCQGFSIAGRKFSDDPRNFLFKEFLRAVRVFEPCWVVMENVPNLLNTQKVIDAIMNDFSDLESFTGDGYEVQTVVVNAAHFGVPQTRTRLFIVARRRDVRLNKVFNLAEIMEPRFLESPSLFGDPTYITFDEAVSDLPYIGPGEGAEQMCYVDQPQTSYQRLMRGESTILDFFQSKGIQLERNFGAIKPSSSVYNHKAQNHNQLLIDRFDNIPQGGTKEDLRAKRPDLLPPSGHPEQGLTYGRLWADRAASTIPANYSRPSGNRSIHPWIPRLITPREAMRLSSFPDYYKLEGLMGAQREQVGNAVPPLLAFHLADKIAEVGYDTDTTVDETEIQENNVESASG
jgi:DNA (cytosine-5)-methyltransferase 1